MTDAVGLEPGIVGTLIMASKLLDGVTDIFCGGIIDKTHSKMGKARPWMFFSGFPLAVCMVLTFVIPENMGDIGKYIWFFIFYTCGNALFYTANNIAYSTMSALITKNDAEKVSLGSFRYISAVVASISIMSGTVIIVEAMGGGMNGWRTVAFIFAAIYLIFNTIASLSCKELPEEESIVGGEDTAAGRRSGSFLHAFKLVITNKYYLLLLALYLLLYTGSNLGSSTGIYYYTYVLGDPTLMGVVSLASFVMIPGLIINPMLVKKFGMYKVNLVSYIVTCLVALLSIHATYTANFTEIVILAFMRTFSGAFLIGSLNALVAAVAHNNWLRHGVHSEGMMFSCSSIGIKLGGGFGAGICGWVLSAVGYIGNAAVQSATVISAIKFLSAGLPFIFCALMVVCLYFMNVDGENKKMEDQQNEK